MTYDEATRHATWDEAVVYALGLYAGRQASRHLGRHASQLADHGRRCQLLALSRELTLADRDLYEFRLSAYPFAYPTGPSVVLS